MRALVLNSGSSSIKFKIFDMGSQKVLNKGTIEELKGNRHKELEKIINSMYHYPFLFTGWLGSLVTALNLLPEIGRASCRDRVSSPV